LRTRFPGKDDECQPTRAGQREGFAETESKPKDVAGKTVRFRVSTAIGMGLVFGFYFVAEHGILNWWSMYCIQGLSLSNTTASLSVSLFFTTLTIGRLVFSPLVQKLGARKSIILMGGLGTVVYVVGVLVGVNGIWLVGASGALFSIVYPTGVLFLQELFPKQSIATATGLVLSIATMFDVGFNAVFGNLLEAVGFGVCRVIFPTAMGLFFLLFLAVTGRRAGQTPEHLI
jgi:fucose permease